MQKLPITYNPLQKNIMHKLIEAHKALAELNWVSQKIPNRNILINALALQEAKDSSEIENIITTHDELYKSQLWDEFVSQQAKEVVNYKTALLYGFDAVQKNKLILNRDILKIQEIIEENTAGFRTQPWTTLTNDVTWEVVYVPPQNNEDIVDLMSNFQEYINLNNEIDPLINMAIIHHQFESIHPFYDGNGRTWRILNIIYLAKHDLLDLPILYLSNYIIRNKQEYYRLLQHVRDTWEWNEWILYMLDAVEQTSRDTIEMIWNIWNLMWDTKRFLKTTLPKIYSKDLLEILFSHPYTKIDFLVEWLGIHRETSSKYLKTLVDHWYLFPVQIKNSKYFINAELFKLLQKWL